MKGNVKSVLGWLGITVSLVFSSLWAYWGAIENFHEGWYSTSVWENLFMLVFQYLLFALVFMALGLVALRWRRVGLVLHVAVAIGSAWFFSGASFNVVGILIVIPVMLLGLLYFFGNPKPRTWAYRLLLGIPLTIILAISIPQGIKVSQRIDDGDRNMRTVEGSGVTLIWAPRGPGWPDRGVSWTEAQHICEHLSEDGTTVMAEKQDFWRLPTIDEAVRSMMLHGKNAGGTWDAKTGVASYGKTPDKESPLWDVHSKVIYYWTAEAPAHDDRQAYIIVYHGGVHDKRKTDAQPYLSFRAVKEPAFDMDQANQ